MNLAQLQAVLTPVDGSVSVTGAQLSSASITTVLAMYFDGTLTIAGADLTSDPTTQSVTVTGTLALIALTMNASATFTLEGGIPQLVMAAQESGAPAWTFARSFGTIADPVLAELSFDTPRWTLRSVATDNRPAGLWLDAAWTPPAALDAIAWLLGGSIGQMSVGGPLQLVLGLPQAAFAVGSSYQHSFGGIALSIGLAVLSIVSPRIKESMPPTLMGGYELATILSNKAGTVTVPAAAILTSDFDTITISADTSRAIDITIDQIGEWIGGDELSGSGIPAGIGTAALSVTLLQIVIWVPTQSVVSVSGVLALSGTWPIVPNVLTIGSLALNLYVSDPFGSSRSFTNTVTGVLSVDVSGGEPILIDVAAEFPDFTVMGSLPDGNDSQPSLAGMMAGAHGVGSSAGFADTLAISSLNILAHPSAATYSFEISVAGDWQILEDLSLIDFGLRILYSAGDLSATLEVGLILAGINIALVADYDLSTGGWLLSGQTGPGQAIAIGDVVADMLALFGASTTLPDSLAGLVIDDLSITFNTQNFDVHLGLGTQFPIGGQALDAVITIDYAKTQSGGYSVDFSGVVDIDKQEFALVFDEVSGS